MTDNIIVCAYIKFGFANFANFQSKCCDFFARASGSTVFFRNVLVVKLLGGLVHAQFNGP